MNRIQSDAMGPLVPRPRHRKVDPAVKEALAHAEELKAEAVELSAKSKSVWQRIREIRSKNNIAASINARWTS